MHHVKIVGDRIQGLRISHKKKSPVVDAFMKLGNDFLLGIQIEINQDIAAEKDIVSAER